MTFYAKLTRISVLLCVAVAFTTLFVWGGFAEELRILTIQGTTPDTPTLDKRARTSFELLWKKAIR
jgi:hypothetical protein